jgi:hypothetical protein
MTVERLKLALVAGCGRSSAMSRKNLLEHLSWDGDPSHLEDNIAAGAHNLRTDLDQFLFKLVSDQSLIGSGIARVRRKLPRL